ncbi:hypothetical protein [Dankookia sp. P2]|uniref:hypothetical protein n=1 Tax=Dankookia sp. P2 TaxID=3423955 RepID=UPI003D666B1F
MAMERQFRLLLLALGAMFAQQTFASIGRGLPAVVAPAVIADLHFDPAWFGTYVSLSALAALTFQLGCGSFLIRHGALRMSQVALVMLGIGLGAAASGNVLLFIVSAVIGGGGAAVSTPASFAPARPLLPAAHRTAGLFHQADGGARRPAAGRAARPGADRLDRLARHLPGRRCGLSWLRAGAAAVAARTSTPIGSRAAASTCATSARRSAPSPRRATCGHCRWPVSPSTGCRPSSPRTSSSS